MALLKPLKEFKTLIQSYTVIDETLAEYKVRNLYKYMDLETALICLKMGISYLFSLQNDQANTNYKESKYFSPFIYE